MSRLYITPEQGIESANCTLISGIKVFKHTDSCPKDILVEIFPKQVAFLSRRGLIRRDSSPLDCIDIPRQAFFSDGDQTICREGVMVWSEPALSSTTTTTLSASQELNQMKQIMTKIFDKELTLESASNFQYVQSLVFESFQSTATIIIICYLALLAFLQKRCKPKKKEELKAENELKPATHVYVEMEKSNYFFFIFSSLIQTIFSSHSEI